MTGISASVSVIVANSALPVASAGEWVYRVRSTMSASETDGGAWATLRIEAEEGYFIYLQCMAVTDSFGGVLHRYLRWGYTTTGDTYDLVDLGLIHDVTSGIPEGIGEIRIERDADGDFWHIYVDDELQAEGQLSTAMLHWDTVVAECYRSPAGTTTASHDDTTVYWGDNERTWEWNDAAELLTWNINHATTSIVTGGVLTCDAGQQTSPGVARVVGRFRPPCEPTVAVCQGRNGTWFAAVATHEGMQTNPTVRCYQRIGSRAWALRGVIAAPEDLGGPGEQDRCLSAPWWGTTFYNTSWRNRPYVHGSVMVCGIEERVDGAVVVALGRNPYRVLLNAEDPNTTPTLSDVGTWWAVSRNCGASWDLYQAATLGASNRVAGFTHDPEGRLWCHLIETNCTPDSAEWMGPQLSVIRHRGAVGWARDFTVMQDEAIGGNDWPGAENSEVADGWIAQLKSGLVVLAATEPEDYRAWVEAMPSGIHWAQRTWQWEGYYPYAAGNSGVASCPGAPPAVVRPDGTAEVVWRGIMPQVGEAVDTTHLWHFSVQGGWSWKDLAFREAAPTHQVCELTEEELRRSQVQVIECPDYSLRVFVNRWQAGVLEEYVSRDGGVHWQAAETLALV